MMGYQAANGAPPPPLPPMGAGGDTSARPQPPLQLPQPRMTYQDRLASQQRQYEYNSVATAPGSRCAHLCLCSLFLSSANALVSTSCIEGCAALRKR